MAKFMVYTDSKGEYRWRMLASNGKTIATGGEGYRTRASVLKGIESVRKNAAGASIEDAKPAAAKPATVMSETVS